MRVLNIQSNYNNISYKGFSRTVYKPGATQIEANVLHRNNSSFLREDYNIKSILNFFAKTFKDVDKVSFYDYASSIGLEAYSFLLGMDLFLDAGEAKKFLPIYARDYDEEVINLALRRQLEIQDSEKYKLEDNMVENFNKNFYPINQNELLTTPTYRVSDKYASQVNFEVGDITKDYINLPKENVILSVRNCWPYFSKEDQLYLPEKLCNHFEKNAVIMIGSFDFRTQHSKDFLKNGFKKAYVKTNGAVFVK